MADPQASGLRPRAFNIAIRHAIAVSGSKLVNGPLCTLFRICLRIWPHVDCKLSRLHAKNLPKDIDEDKSKWQKSHPEEPMDIEESEADSDCFVLDLNTSHINPYSLQPQDFGPAKIINGFLTLATAATAKR